jgi:hypothetical protein
MDAIRPARRIAVVSARADGASTMALGLAAVLSASGRTALVDGNFANGDLAAFLDLEDSKTLYHLAYNAQLAPVSDADLRDHLQWHAGLAVLPGITHPRHQDQITAPFLAGLLQTVGTQFATVVIDAGRSGARPVSEIPSDLVLWPVVPRPLGMAAFDRAYRVLEEGGAPWLARVQLIVNRTSGESLTGVAAFLQTEYGLPVAGEIPDCPAFWLRAELSHSLRALAVPVGDRQRYVRAYGEEAIRTREALEAVTNRLAPAPVAGTVSGWPR